MSHICSRCLEDIFRSNFKIMTVIDNKKVCEGCLTEAELNRVSAVYKPILEEK